MQPYFHGNAATAQDNNNFRHVVYTAAHIQVVLMSVPAGQEIGEEVHDNHDQLFTVVSGEGKVLIGEEEM